VIRRAVVSIGTSFDQEGFERWLLAVLKNLAKDPETVSVEPVRENENA
jgi:hypothetical protein